MTWHAHILHTPEGLALSFREPTSRLDMAPDVAAHLASLLAMEARQRLRGVVAALEGDRQDGHSECFLPENMPIQVIGDAHPLCCDCDDCLNGGCNV